VATNEPGPRLVCRRCGKALRAGERGHLDAQANASNVGQKF
jgi:hypothetical protein